MSNITTSDCIDASRQAKSLTLNIKETNLMDIIKRLTAKKKITGERLKVRPDNSF